MANDGILMPEIILNRVLKFFFKFLKEDIEENSDPTKTLVYSIFKEDRHGLSKNIETFDLYNETLRILMKKEIRVFMGYNMEVSGTGCVHILLPSESGKPLTIGGDEGYVEYQESGPEEDAKTSAVFTQTFDATYQLMVTSENSLEAVIIYNLMKACFLSLFEHLELAGLRDIKTSGQDLSMQSDLVPPHVFHRSLMIGFFYENNVPSHFKDSLIRKFVSTGIINNNE
jgi:hypothetical protein